MTKISIGNIAGKEIFIEGGTNELELYAQLIKERIKNIKIAEDMSLNIPLNTEAGKYLATVTFEKM